uniref:MOSC domain-containing protein n=1 Tax=Odontella aurita TaxID=265563 RepID=A0A7S4JAB4_9STRA|mmetsp:Transcript_4245/g.11779  ORF Transcript_4245/g.11779 Transcript_4245/m.11779 type:complete len:451 (+) Transcript_4245:130-1482(+)
MPPPFHLHNDAANHSAPSLSRVFLTALLGSLLPATLIFGRPRLKRILATHRDRRRLRRIADELDRKKKDGQEGGSCDDVVVSGLFVHPVKSLRPVPVQSSALSHLGLRGDRTLMLVRPRPKSLTSSTLAADPSAPTHRFVTQRQCPQLARIDASLPVSVNGGRTVVRFSCDLLPTSEEAGGGDGSGSDSAVVVHVDVSPDAVARYPLRYTAGLWDDAVEVADVGDDAAAFLREAVKAGMEADRAGGIKLETDDGFRDVRLVALLPGGRTARPLPEAYLPPAAWTSAGSVPHTSLNDGFPILVANEASLEELNRRLEQGGKDPVPMSRFRPNIVVRGKAPFEEDTWKAIRIRSPDMDIKRRRETILHLVKGCPRCKQSCTDQASGQRHVEPLETLATFRAVNPRCEEDVYFAQNAVPQMGGESAPEVQVGDVVEVLTRGEPVWDKEDVKAE